jgi:autotransporter-associated beta strand protein
MSSDSAFSQSTFTWNGGNGSWTSPGNWTISGNATGYPDEAGDMVSFTNNSGTYDVSTPTAGNGTAVVGSITTNGAGTVRLGNSTTFAGSLSLNSTSGAPILSVNTGRLAIFTELVGSQGFRKTGNGILNFNTNTLDMNNLTGDVSIEDGTVWFNQAGNFGSGNLSFSGSNTIFQMRALSTTTFAANRTLTISSGSNITFQNFNAASSAMVIDGTIAGSGNLTFSNGNFTLNGANTHSGATTLSASGSTASVNLSLAAGSFLSSSTLSFTSLGNASLDLGANSQTISNLITESSNAGSAMSISNGSLTISGGGDISLGGRGGAFTLSLAGLTAFTAGSASSNLTFQSGDSSGTTTNTLILSTNGTNTLVGQTVLFGRTNAGGNADGAAYSANVNLGTTNTIRADVFKVGSTNSTAALAFQSGLSNPSLVLRSANGTAAVREWTIGEVTADTGGRSGQGTVDLLGGTLDALVGNLTVGLNNNATVTSTSWLKMSNGTLTADTIRLATKSGASTGGLSGAIYQSGGNVSTQTLEFGQSGSGNSTITALYEISGGRLEAGMIQAGGGNFTSSSNRTLAVSGNATLSNISGANLTITGTDATTGGRVNLTISGNAILESGAGQHITMGAHTLLGGSGNLTKTGTGDLILNSNLNHSYSGTANINAGRLLVYSSNMTSATINLNGGTFTGNTTVAGIRISSNTVFDIAEGNRISANTTFSGSQAFSKNGTGELAIGNGGSQTYNGTATLNAGRLTLNSNMSSASLLVHSGIVSGNGTVGPITLNGDSQFDISSNQTLTAFSTLSGSANFSKTGNGSLSIANANAYSGTVTLSTGNLTIGSDMTNATLTLAGGTLGGNGTIGAVVLASNSTFNAANSSRLVIGSSGSLSGSANLIKSGNGTLAINASTDQTYSGAMTLNGGNLIVNSNLSSAGTTTVNASTATLAGSGSLGNVTLTRGILSPGEGALGTLSVKTFTWSANGTMKFDLASDSTSSDQLAITGNFSRSGTGNFTFNLVGGQDATTYTLVTWTGTTTFTAANFFSTGQTGNFSISSNQLQFTTVPEPGTVGFVLFAAAGIFLWRRVKKSQQTGGRVQKKSNHC